MADLGDDKAGISIIAEWIERNAGSVKNGLRRGDDQFEGVEGASALLALCLDMKDRAKLMYDYASVLYHDCAGVKEEIDTLQKEIDDERRKEREIGIPEGSEDGRIEGTGIEGAGGGEQDSDRGRPEDGDGVD
jgi:hypothetical protein